MLTESLLGRLKTKIGQIEADAWNQRGAPAVRLSDDIREDEISGTLKGRIEVLVKTKDGVDILVHEQPLNGVATDQDVDNCLAEALSIALMKHPDWPR